MEGEAAAQLMSEATVPRKGHIYLHFTGKQYLSPSALFLYIHVETDKSNHI